MVRKPLPVLAIASQLTILAIALLAPIRSAMATPEQARAACYAAVIDDLKQTGGVMTPKIREDYVSFSEGRVLMLLDQAGWKAPTGLIDEIHNDPITREAIYASVFPSDPSILQNYATLTSALPLDTAIRYRNLLIGVAISRRTHGVESDVAEVGNTYQLGFWIDESLDVPGDKSERAAVQMVADYMKLNNVSALQLFNDRV